VANPFTALISDIGQTLAGLRQNAFSSVQNPFGGNASFGGGQNPFGGGSPFQAQQPFQGNTWRIGNIGGGFQVSNPFGGQNPFNVSNFQQTPSAQTSGDSASGPTSDGSGDPGTAKWRPLIDSAAQQVGIDPDVIQAIMMTESGGNPDSVSSAGALGLMQVMPFHFASGENGLDPKTNILKGAQILADNYKRYGNWDTAVAAYLGAVDANGNITNAADAYGTTGPAYVQRFHENLNKLKAAVAPTQGSGDLDQLANGGVQWAAKARTVMGVAYTNGGIRETGDPRSGMDCSSFVGWAKGLDRNLWNAQAQYDASRKIDAAQLQPGDLVFFQGTTNDDPSARPVTHVGIYIGGGKMVHTGGSPGVQVVDLNTDYWRQHLYGYGRLG
jgi:cell wall-associated NlpC family hydrolase